MAIQFDKSLYSRLNAETRAAVDAVNEASKLAGLFQHPQWGCQTTLRQKQEFLKAHSNPRGMDMTVTKCALAIVASAAAAQFFLLAILPALQS